MNDDLRSLPGVDRVIAALHDAGPAPVVADAARRVIDEARSEVIGGGLPPSFEEIVERTRSALSSDPGRGLRSVINATGVLIHTNLGRSPLGDAQLAAIRDVGSGYSNLEFDVASGGRGRRNSHTRRALTTLTGAESSLVVNNNAAAVLLVLSALCAGREVVISRGELVEIGGEFRIPEVMAASGARLVEVGTTNRTHLKDYERAITSETAAILKVHPSNYQVVGFTSSVPARELAGLARDKGIHLIHDVGSGLVERAPHANWTTSEPSIAVALEEGADLVTFSGDKLFGGPQAGIIVGRSELIERLEKHPLMRALRVDKITLAALEATADAYLRGELEQLPLWAMALASEDELRERAEQVERAIKDAFEPHAKVEASQVMSTAGGGSVPGSQIPSWGVTISGCDVDALQSKLRSCDPPVVTRVNDDRVVLDLRTVAPSQQDELIAALISSQRA